jgi:hypothetical protein
MIETIINWIALAVFAGCFYRALRVANRSHSWSIWFLAGGFAMSIIVRVGISLSLPFLDPHSRPITSATAILFYIGMTGIDRASAHYPRAKDFREYATADKAARLVHLAAEASSKAADAASKAAEAASVAAAMAHESHIAASGANGATRESRK